MLIVISYILIAYRPDVDPFVNKRSVQGGVGFKPNSTDMAIVALIQRYMPFLRNSPSSRHTRDALNHGFIKVTWHCSTSPSCKVLTHLGHAHHE